MNEINSYFIGGNTNKQYQQKMGGHQYRGTNQIKFGRVGGSTPGGASTPSHLQQQIIMNRTGPVKIRGESGAMKNMNKTDLNISGYSSNELDTSQR